MGVLLPPKHPLCRRVCMDDKKTKIFKNLNIRDIQNAYHRIEILRIRNCIDVTVTLYFHLETMFKSVSLNILELKLVKVDCI